jgi:hypothetical protein
VILQKISDVGSLDLLDQNENQINGLNDKYFNVGSIALMGKLFVCLFVHWFVCLLVFWFVCLFVYWFGWLVGWLVGWFGCLLVGWLTFVHLT